MANLDLTKYGISGTVEIVHNPSYDVLFAEETKAGLEGFEKGQATELGAVNVMTGIYTGRSPKDKFLVKDATSENTVWWTSEEYKNDNKPVSTETWNVLKDLAAKELSNKRLFVVDGYCGANEATRLKVRFIMEVAWQAHFVTNMFIRPSKEELESFEPDFVVYNASKAKVENYKELGLNSETAVSKDVQQKFGNETLSVMANKDCTYDNANQSEFAEIFSSAESYRKNYDYSAGDIGSDTGDLEAEFLSDPSETPEEFGQKIEDAYVKLLEENGK